MPIAFTMSVLNRTAQFLSWLLHIAEPVQKKFARLACMKIWSAVTVGLTCLLIRLALLPIISIPQPAWHDEFSYLLAADTFAHGRPANPTHPMWVHFETFHVLQQPTYSAMYPPAQGLVLAMGQFLGHPWIGEWLLTGFMCSAMCWMLQGWLPSKWALYGSLLAMLRLGILSYWMNGYWSSSVVALGGALVLGALPRIKKGCRTADAVVMGIGLAILANSRPSEGFALAVMVAVALLFWMWHPKSPPLRTLCRQLIIPVSVVLLIAALATGYFYYHVTGNPLRMGYQVDSQTYNPVPSYLWQSAKPEPHYHHEIMRQFYEKDLQEYFAHRSIWGFLKYSYNRTIEMWAFYLRTFASIPLLILPWLWRDRRMRFPLIAGGAFYLFLMSETWCLPHYAAPAAGLLFLIVAQCSRRLALWTWRQRPIGALIVAAVPLLLIGALALRITTIAVHSKGAFQPGNFYRAAIINELNQFSGQHLVIVTYAPKHNLDLEWVYNSADIDGSHVVWARDMGDKDNQELLRYFKDRKVWHLVVGEALPRLLPYASSPAPE